MKGTRVFESYLNSVCSFFTFVLVARFFSSEIIALYAVIVTASQFIVSFQNSYISYPIINGESREVKSIILNLLIFQVVLLALVFTLIRIFYFEIYDAINPFSILILLYAFPFYEAIRKYFFNTIGAYIIFWTLFLRFTPLLWLFIVKPKTIEEFTTYLAVPLIITHVYIIFKKRNSFFYGVYESLTKHLKKHRLLLVSSVLEIVPTFMLLLVMQKSLSALFIGEFRKVQSIYGLLGPFFSYILLSKISSKAEFSMGKRQSFYFILFLVVLISIFYPFLHALVYKESFIYISLIPFFVVSYLFQGVVSNQRSMLISSGNYTTLTYVALFVVCYMTLVLFLVPRQLHVGWFGFFWSMISIVYFIGYWRVGKIK